MLSDICILIVDDSKTVLRVVRKMLVELGFEKIDQASDGAMACELLRENNKKYDLVISDWNMGTLSGFELLRLVRAGQAGRKDIPFIMATTECKPDFVIAAKQEGVTNYIVKPFTPEALNTKIHAILKDRIHASRRQH